MVSVKQIAAIAAMATLSLGLNASSKPTSLRPVDPKSAASTTPVPSEEYHLRMHHLHTGEDIDVVYRIGNTYVPVALDQLNHFLRDHRTEDVRNSMCFTL